MSDPVDSTRQLATLCIWCYRFLLVLAALPLLFFGYFTTFKQGHMQGILFLGAGIMLVVSEFMFRYLDRMRGKGK